MQKSPSWMASDAEKQRDNIIQKAKILCFQGHTKSFAIQQGIFLYHVTVRILKRAHRIACVNGGGGSGRKNVMSMRELFCPDPLAGFEKMAGFQIFYCLKIRCFHS